MALEAPGGEVSRMLKSRLDFCAWHGMAAGVEVISTIREVNEACERVGRTLSLRHRQGKPAASLRTRDGSP